VLLDRVAQKLKPDPEIDVLGSESGPLDEGLELALAGELLGLDPLELIGDLLVAGLDPERIGLALDPGDVEEVVERRRLQVLVLGGALLRNRAYPGPGRGLLDRAVELLAGDRSRIAVEAVDDRDRIAGRIALADALADRETDKQGHEKGAGSDQSSALGACHEAGSISAL
jgi:hypothetical protein